MRIGLGSAIIALLVLPPLASCGYFGFIHYPREVQRFERGQYLVVVQERPSQMLVAPELIVGSLHNNTTLEVSLIRNGESIERKILVWGEDLPSDHLPVEASWNEGYVDIKEPKNGESVRLRLPGGGA